MDAGEFAGLNIEEPEFWGSQRPPRTGNGYNLSLATKISFDVRTPSSAPFKVQFSVGDCVAPFVSIPARWTRMSIKLTDLLCSRDPPIKLSQVNLLFGINTNDLHAPAGGTVLLDNIEFDALSADQLTIPSFPLSTQTFGIFPRSTAAPGANPANGRPTFPHDQVLRNLSTTYESALVGIAAARRGTPQGVAEARQIADALSYALHHPNQGNKLPTTASGDAGLQNGYFAGDLPLFNSQGPLPSSQQGDVRLAGFWVPACQGCGGSFKLLLDGATGGNGAFAIMALVGAYGVTGKTRYLDDARQIGRWIIGQLFDDSTGGFGGFFVGFQDDGLPANVLIRGKSTENNADIFHAFSLLAGLVVNRAEAQEWQRNANLAGDFAMAMFDPASGCFHAGTVPLGTSGLGVSANGTVRGGEVINTYPFLDSNSFTVLPMAGTGRYRNVIDWRRPVQCIGDRFGKQVYAGGTTFNGMSIAPDALGGQEGIAWEFTGQAIVAMRLVDRLYKEQRFAAQADRLNVQMRQAQLLAPFGDGKGLVASTLQAGDTLAPIDQCLITPFQCIPERVGLAATVWAVLADEDINPFGIAPKIRVDISWLDFGTAVLGSGPRRQAISVFNQGNLSAAVRPVLPGRRTGDEFAIAAETCSAAPLTPGAQCTVQVDFTPQIVGPRIDQLTLSISTTEATPLSVPLVALVTSDTVRLDPDTVDAIAGKAFRLTVSVPTASPAGTLVARDGQTEISRCMLVRGSCTLDLTLAQAGNHTLRFDYSVDGATTLSSVAKVVNVKLSPEILTNLILRMLDP